MEPQKFIITIKSPSGHGNYQDVIQKEIQMWFWQRGFDKTIVAVEEIFEEETKWSENVDELI